MTFVVDMAIAIHETKHSVVVPEYTNAEIRKHT